MSVRYEASSSGLYKEVWPQKATLVVGSLYITGCESNANLARLDLVGWHLPANILLACGLMALM